MPIWDGITSDVRHYDVSEYVLRGWTPVLRTHGVLVMARNDLVASRPVPALTTPPQTTDLYFSGPTCDWGATPNYLPVPDSYRATTLPVRSAIPRTVVYYSGWAVDPATNRPASTVLIADGDRVVGTVTPSINRPDVAQDLHQPSVGERLPVQRLVRCRGPPVGLSHRRGRAGPSARRVAGRARCRAAPAGREPGRGRADRGRQRSRSTTPTSPR